MIPWFRRAQLQSSQNSSPQSSSRAVQPQSLRPQQLQQTAQPCSNPPVLFQTPRVYNEQPPTFDDNRSGTSFRAVIPQNQPRFEPTPPVHDYTFLPNSVSRNQSPVCPTFSITNQPTTIAAAPPIASRPPSYTLVADSKPFVDPNYNALPRSTPHEIPQTSSGPFTVSSNESSEDEEPDPKRLKLSEQHNSPAQRKDKLQDERDELRKASERLRLAKQAMVAQAKNVVDLSVSESPSPRAVVIDLEKSSNNQKARAAPLASLQSLQATRLPIPPNTSVATNARTASITRDYDGYPTSSSSNETFTRKHGETACTERWQTQARATASSPSLQPKFGQEPRIHNPGAVLQKEQQIQALRGRNEGVQKAVDLTVRGDEVVTTKHFQQEESLLARLTNLQPSDAKNCPQPAELAPSDSVEPKTPIKHNREADPVQSVSRVIPMTLSSASKSQSPNRRLGEIFPHDIWLVEWRDDNIEWPTIVKSLGNTTGLVRSKDTWRKRYSVVKHALEEHEVSAELLNRVSAQEKGAIVELNTLIHGVWPLSKNTAATSPLKPSNPPAVNKRAKASLKYLGEILPEDVRLYLWRSNGKLWSEIIPAWEELTSKRSCQSRLHDHYEMVKTAVTVVNANNALLCRVASSEPAAREELNRAVHGKWPVDFVIRKVDLPPIDYVHVTPKSPRDISKASESARTNPSAQNALRNAALPAPAERSNLVTGQTAPGSTVTPPRPTTGGKTLNEEALRYYMDIQAENFEQLMDDQVDDDEREESPFADKDQCHFLYHIERRELIFEEEDDDDPNRIDELPWIECGKEYETLAKANAKVYQHAFSLGTNGHSVVCPDSKWSFESEKDDLGRLLVKVSSAVGIVQVRVTRSMRSFHEGILPKSKANWAPKIVYHVKKRTTVTTPSTDPLFEEPTTTFSEEIVGDTYTTIEQANLRAVQHIVDLTFTSDSLNLNIRDAEKQEEIEAQLKELEEHGDDAAYSGQAEDEAKGLTILVEVVVGKLSGPRNL